MNRKHLKWGALIGLILMLLAIAGYILTLDDSDPDIVPQEIKAIK